MNTKNLLDPILSKLKSDVFTSSVVKTMSEYFSSPPPNLLESKKTWEKKKRKELMDLYSGQASIDKTCTGFDAILEDLKTHLAPSALKKISQEWEQGIETWISRANSKAVETNESLQKILGISEETLNHFYHAANRYFKHKDYQKASDAFYVITGLDPYRYNVWLSLGLSEAHNQHFEQALISFSMASITDADSPFPYIYSAECCLKDNRLDEAKIYLKLAKGAIEQGRFENKESLLNSIQKLDLSCKKKGDV